MAAESRRMIQDTAYIRLEHTLCYDYSRTSLRMIGGLRHLPPAKDVLDCAIAGNPQSMDVVKLVSSGGIDRRRRVEPNDLADKDDILLFTTADICLCVDALLAIRDAMQGAGCCYSHPADVPSGIAAGWGRSRIIELVKSGGVNLFAFTRAWWRGSRERMPDVFLGAKGWDAVLCRMMDEANPHAEVWPAVCYHPMHTAYWWEHMMDDPAQQHNRKLCRQWAESNGYGADSIFCAL